MRLGWSVPLLRVSKAAAQFSRGRSQQFQKLIYAALDSATVMETIPCFSEALYESKLIGDQGKSALTSHIH